MSSICQCEFHCHLLHLGVVLEPRPAVTVGVPSQNPHKVFWNGFAQNHGIIGEFIHQRVQNKPFSVKPPWPHPRVCGRHMRNYHYTLQLPGSTVAADLTIIVANVVPPRLLHGGALVILVTSGEPSPKFISKYAQARWWCL